MAQLPDGVEMAERLWEEMQEFFDSGRKLTMPRSYFTGIPRLGGKSWFQATYEQATERAIVEGAAPVFIAWDLASDFKKVRLPSPADEAVHRALCFGVGDEKRFGAAQYMVTPEEAGDSSNAD